MGKAKVPQTSKSEPDLDLATSNTPTSSNATISSNDTNSTTNDATSVSNGATLVENSSKAVTTLTSNNSYVETNNTLTTKKNTSTAKSTCTTTKSAPFSFKRRRTGMVTKVTKSKDNAAVLNVKQVNSRRIQAKNSECKPNNTSNTLTVNKNVSSMRSRSTTPAESDTSSSSLRRTTRNRTQTKRFTDEENEKHEQKFRAETLCSSKNIRSPAETETPCKEHRNIEVISNASSSEIHPVDGIKDAIEEEGLEDNVVRLKRENFDKWLELKTKFNFSNDDELFEHLLTQNQAVSNDIKPTTHIEGVKECR